MLGIYSIILLIPCIIGIVGYFSAGNWVVSMLLIAVALLLISFIVAQCAIGKLQIKVDKLEKDVSSIKSKLP